jgi:hypothetical protein
VAKRLVERDQALRFRPRQRLPRDDQEIDVARRRLEIAHEQRAGNVDGEEVIL